MVQTVALTILLAGSFGLWLGWFLRSRKRPQDQSEPTDKWFTHLFKTNKQFDGTMLLFGFISLCHLALLGLFLLEILCLLMPLESDKVRQMVIFSPEINHTLLTVTISALAGFGGYFFGKASQQEATERDQAANGGQPK